ncbi:MAG: GH25 family lysozyme [Acutalibacteraceae bacterium]
MKIIKTAICSVLSLLLCICCVSPSFALAPLSERVYDGIDVSVYQGEIDFEKVRQSSADVVYIRAGYGVGLEDEYFRRNAAEAREHRLRFGFYFYVTARTPYEAELQGRYFASIISNTDYDCRPAMDFEEFSGLSVKEIREIGLAFMKALEERTRILPIIYSDAYAASYVWGEDFARYPLWVADYGPTEPDVESEIWKGWSGFQYSDNGRVNGINGAVDLDKFTAHVFLTEDEKAEKCG